MNFFNMGVQNLEGVSCSTGEKKITQQRYNYTDPKTLQTIALELENRILWSYHRCKLCPYKTKRFELVTKHLTRHKVTKKSKMFNCMGTNMDRYKCNLCTFKTSLLVLFNKHMEMYHRGDPPMKSENSATEYFDFLNLFKTYSCDKCTFKTASQYLYIRHFSKCPVVNFLSKRRIYKTKTKEGEYEVEIVEKFDTYDCSMCSFTTKRKIMLDKHLYSKHALPNTNLKQSEKYVCRFCPYKARFQYEIKTHLKVHHDGPDKYKKIYCEYCKFSTDKEPKGLLNHYLTEHMDRINVNIPEPTEKKEHLNDKNLTPTNDKIQSQMGRNKDVDKKIQTLRTKNRSKKTKRKKDQSQLTCSQCDFSTNYIIAYQNHLKFRHVSDKNISWMYCNKCSYKTVFEHKLKEHKEISHRPGKYWECSTCLGRIPIAKSFHSRRLAHLEKCKNTVSKKVIEAPVITKELTIPLEKISECAKCDYKSHIKKNYREHKCEKKTVRNAEPFEEVIAAPVSRVSLTWYHCDSGDFKTKDHNLLREHILNKHVSYKYVICHRCDLCEFKTIDEEDLKKHVSDKHVDPQYTNWVQCEICPDKFKNDDELKTHVMTKHIL